ncbi:protease inhibitor Inh/omp19 family protein [Jiella marina]|uniref:protease inhibitor Inh/omp19 family protein n=1 Tax=Jiella sp. LLJ827 TaxID=2917712 RepID=UPI0021008D25|nr:protease inhibitor Inh/omp19 family protein [Jiella sp. LLJ827]MCQ0989544.1 protease inhibitor Inh/omp19 family protein [Jiella sp. LLJ827]
MNQALRTTAVLAVLLAAAGCSRSVPSYYDSGPAPLTPAPTGRVAANQLPPPPPPPPPGNDFDSATDSDGAEASPSGDQSDASATGDQQNTQVAAVSQPALSRNSVLGAYKVTTDGGNCQIILSLTKWSGGYRAASRGCPGRVADVSAWDVSGSQVVLKDGSGSNVANLSSSGDSRYEGRTTGGQSISLYR